MEVDVGQRGLSRQEPGVIGRPAVRDLRSSGTEQSAHQHATPGASPGSVLMGRLVVCAQLRSSGVYPQQQKVGRLLLGTGRRLIRRLAP